MINVSVSGKTLRWQEGGRQVEVSLPTRPLNWCVLEHLGIVVVAVEGERTAEPDRNLWAFREDGGLLWRASPSASEPDRDDLFISVVNHHGELLGMTFQSKQEVLDPMTGKCLLIRQSH